MTTKMTLDLLIKSADFFWGNTTFCFFNNPPYCHAITTQWAAFHKREMQFENDAYGRILHVHNRKDVEDVNLIIKLLWI